MMNVALSQSANPQPSINQAQSLSPAPTALSIRDLNLFYGDKQALFDVNMNIVLTA